MKTFIDLKINSVVYFVLEHEVRKGNIVSLNLEERIGTTFDNSEKILSEIMYESKCMSKYNTPMFIEMQDAVDCAKSNIQKSIELKIKEIDEKQKELNDLYKLLISF